MPFTNPYFSNTTGVSGEVGLLDDLTREQIRMFGVDLLYMPRKMLNLDRLLHESTKNAFELALPMPMFVKSFDGYDNGLEALTKFGVRASDELTLQMSRSEFTAHYAPFLKAYYNANAGRPSDSKLDRLEGETDARPKEGDLIYFPFDDSIFEIKYVQFDVPFFQLGKGYIFELQCEKFEYSGDTFETGYEVIDDTSKQPDYYRMEFELESDSGKGSFIFKEKVTIYNMEGEYEVIDGGKALVDYVLDVLGDLKSDSEVPPTLDLGGVKDILYKYPQDVFRLYKDPGFLNQLEKVEGTVEVWELPNGKLTLSDLTDLDPEQTDLYKDLIVNKFDKVVIVGQSSGAIWYSEKAKTEDKAFDDALLIQREFDDIKVIDDPEDVNPFGFV